jgi:hypothetical protein
MKHRAMLIVTGAVLHDGVFRGNRLDLLVIGDLIERHAITAARVYDGAMRDLPSFEQTSELFARPQTAEFKQFISSEL